MLVRSAGSNIWNMSMTCCSFSIFFRGAFAPRTPLHRRSLGATPPRSAPEARSLRSLAMYPSTRTGSASVLFLDRDVHEIAPLGPGAVVVADVAEAEQVLEREPRVAAALADPAVGDRRAGRRQPVVFAVQLLQLVRRLERPVVGVDRLRPRDALRAGDVAAAQRPLVGIVGHVHARARVFLGAADVDELSLLLQVR